MKINFILILLLLIVGAHAQTPFGAAKEKYKKNLFHIDLIAGAMTPSMKFIDTPFDDVDQSTVIDKLGGISLRFQLNKVIALSSQINYRSACLSVPEYNKYSLKSHYINLYTPLELNCHVYRRKRKTEKCLFLNIGPYVAANVGGELSTDDMSFLLTENDIAPYDYGFEVGVGLRIPTYTLSSMSNISIRASYIHGLANTFPSTPNGYSSDQLSDYLMSNTGGRYVRGFQLTLSYELSVEKKTITNFTAGGNGKRSYKKFVVH